MTTLFIKKTKKYLIEISHSRYGLWFITFIAFIESAFFPIPPDFFIIPMIMARPDSWKKIALFVSIGSILGSFLGYYIGFALFESVGEMIIHKYNLASQMTEVGLIYNDNAFWSLFVAAFTPLPYKLFTIAAGVFSVSLIPFTIASVLGRGSRYVLVPYLASLGGRSLRVNKYLKKASKLMWFLVIVFVGYIIVKYLF
ncbi:MAG: DedA family protein [Candidatus Pacebacteria bacterium]|nr:DedA family protein [Candidatus Paceibacterota bacterium]